MSRLARLGVSLLSCFGAGVIGSVFVSEDAAAWYDALQKPFFTPPHWVFPLVWTILYIFMTIALWLVWEKDEDAREGHGWVPLFFAHLLVNLSWTIFFFGFHSIFVALIDVAVLAVCIGLLILGASSIDKRASYLLLPYLAWVCFATILNGAIWYLN